MKISGSRPLGEAYEIFLSLSKESSLKECGGPQECKDFDPSSFLSLSKESSLKGFEFMIEYPKPTTFYLFLKRVL